MMVAKASNEIRTMGTVEVRNTEHGTTKKNIQSLAQHKKSQFPNVRLKA